jgi:hypothetical protein
MAPAETTIISLAIGEKDSQSVLLIFEKIWKDKLGDLNSNKRHMLGKGQEYQ